MFNFRKAWTTDLHSNSLSLTHLTLEQHTRLVGLVTVTQATVHTSQPVCVVAVGLKAQLLRIYTEWLMTQVRYLKRSIHWYYSIVNEVPQLVCMHRVPVCIWKVGLDHPIADRPLLICSFPYLAPALVHHYSWIKFALYFWQNASILLVFCERGSDLSLQVTPAQFVNFKLKVKVQQQHNF